MLKNLNMHTRGHRLVAIIVMLIFGVFLACGFFGVFVMHLDGLTVTVLIGVFTGLAISLSRDMLAVIWKLE